MPTLVYGLCGGAMLSSVVAHLCNSLTGIFDAGTPLESLVRCHRFEGTRALLWLRVETRGKRFNVLRFSPWCGPAKNLFTAWPSIAVAEPFAEVERLVARWPVAPTFRVVPASHSTDGITGNILEIGSRCRGRDNGGSSWGVDCALQAF